MRKILLCTTTIAGILTAAVAPTPANAATYSIPQVVATTSGADFNNYNLVFPRFNSNLGTLTSVLVTVDFSANYHGTASVSSGSATVTLSAATHLGISGGPSVLNGTAVLTVSGSQGVIIPTTTAFAPAGATTNPQSTSYAASADWQGPGGTDTSITLDSSTVANAPLGVSFNPTEDLTLAFDVTYNFTPNRDAPAPEPAPEPASMLMLGAGVLALGVAHRRRRKRQD